jgi:hypothetical protein
VLVFVALLLAVGAVCSAAGLAKWSVYVIGAVAGLAGSYVLGDAGRLPDPFDHPARSDRPHDGSRP